MGQKESKMFEAKAEIEPRKYLTFNNGMKMPVIGLGLYKGIDESDLESIFEKALDAGYRHFDTAYFYETEKALGRAVNKWIESGKGTREELFIVTKLPWNGMEGHKVEYFLNLSLKNLGLDYVDLYLVHWPIAVEYVSDNDFEPRNSAGELLMDKTTDFESIWRAMEAQVGSKRALSIGVSNFNEKQLERIIKIAKIQPVNHQIELHAYFQQVEMREYCKKHGITICAYSPLGGPWRKTFPGLSDNLPESVNLLDNPTIKKIGEKYSKTPGQVALRYLIELGVAVIPKSFNIGRLHANIDILDFELSHEDFRAIEVLDQGSAGRTNSLPSTLAALKDHPEFPF